MVKGWQRLRELELPVEEAETLESALRHAGESTRGLPAQASRVGLQRGEVALVWFADWAACGVE